MPSTIGTLDLQDAAQEAAGNWARFDCFVWFRRDELDDAENWALIYTHHRDSGLLDQSNAAAIAKVLEPFTDGEDPDVVFESHNHWAVSHIDGFSVRVIKNGQISDAFRVYHELAERMADYPILDEDDYSRCEYEATLENIADAAWRLKQDFQLPEDWETEVYDWLSQHRDRAIENRDDQGGYPDEEDLEAAFEALGYQRVE
jgi:hypothetical protein